MVSNFDIYLGTNFKVKYFISYVVGRKVTGWMSFDAMLVDGSRYLTGQGVKAQVRFLVRYSPLYRLGN